jgi:CrcB protein
MTFLAVAAGSAVGGMLRYWLSVTFSGAFPWATFGVNVVGSFLIGILIGFAGSWPPPVRALLIPGFCGGLTTFSTFSADALLLWEQSPARAAGYVGVSVAAALASAWLGMHLVRGR